MRHTWLAVDDRSVSVRVDLPTSDIAHAALVIVPPFGRDAVVCFRTLRVVAARAAARGFAVVSPALTGQGDSCLIDGLDDVAGVWARDVEAAVDLARDLVAAQPVHVLGLRLGACLAGQVEARPGERRVLWEPVTGAALLRNQRTLRRFAVPIEVVPDGVELYAEWLTEQQADSVRRLTWRAAAEQSGVPTVQVRREEPSVARQLSAVSTYHTEVPLEALEEVLDLFPLGGSPAPIRPWTNQVIVGEAILHEHVQLGSRAVHGVLTRPAKGPVTAGLLLPAMGTELMSGPAQLWVRLATELAGHGVAVLRVDRHLLGDSLDVHDPQEPPAYTEEAAVDIAVAARYLQQVVGEPPIGLGVCAGAWCLFKASATTPIAAIVSVNSLHWDTDASVFDRAFYDRVNGREIGFLKELAAAAEATPELPAEESSRRLRLHELVVRGRRLRAQTMMRMPRLAAVLHRRRPPATVAKLLHLVPASTRVTLAMGSAEAVLFRAHRGTRAVRARQQAGAPVEVIVLDNLDHSLASQRGRDEVHSLLLSELGLPATADPPRQ